jgi:hypothetical protein
VTLHSRSAALLLAAGLAVLTGCSTAAGAHQPSASAGIGAWPTFLPSPAAAGQAHGSTSDPAMSYAGSPVVVDLGSSKVTVNVQGPSYPANTKVGADHVLCTFTVVLSGASEPVNLSTARFDVLDHTGSVHVLRAAPGSSVPSEVQPAQTVTLHLVATVPSGEGLLRYAPDGTSDAAGWDYVAETD